MAIGFNTPSKRQAEEMEANSPQKGMQMPEMPVTALQAETYQRVNNLGDFITSDAFAALPIEQKQAVLIDFAYFKSVADNL